MVHELELTPQISLVPMSGCILISRGKFMDDINLFN